LKNIRNYGAFWSCGTYYTRPVQHLSLHQDQRQNDFILLKRNPNYVIYTSQLIEHN